VKYAIRVDADTLLAVPPIHPGTSRADRVRVLEYVLRRQPGMADLLAQEARESITRTGGTFASLAAVMSQTPHKNTRGLGVAA
jgi:hypothetical protein